jgi:hypothetical protein
MKAEHRHQLQTNVLADQMGRLYQNMKSPGQTSSVLGWTLGGLLIVAVVAWQYLAGTALTDGSALWLNADAATHDDPSSMLRRLEILADDSHGTLAGRTARFEVARLMFEMGERDDAIMSRAESVKSLGRARDLYEELSRECADEPLLRQEALMGVAKAEESLAGSKDPANAEEDLKKALESYKKLANEYPDSFQGKAAAARIKVLEGQMTEVAKFYQDLYSAPTSKLTPAANLFPTQNLLSD